MVCTTASGPSRPSCGLVVIDANERGEKHFLAIEDGERESTQSWREVLWKLKARGMNCPQRAIGSELSGYDIPVDHLATEVYVRDRSGVSDIVERVAIQNNEVCTHTRLQRATISKSQELCCISGR